MKLGQYFYVVNKTKRQYLDTDKTGNGAKFLEIIGSYGTTNVLGYLLRQSTGGGGGDIDTVRDMEECIMYAKESMDKAFKEGNQKDYDWNQKYYERYCKKMELAKKQKYVGSWVDDQIAIVGDYDKSDLYRIAEKSFEDITLAVIAEIKEQTDIEVVEGAKFKQMLTPDMVFVSKGDNQ